ncbi:MAG: thioredoxin family protein [Fimbriimonadales bacterium]|nr:thioredoxin family protein [Fimbriimonadales bacterium]MDW8051170.1 cytochrome c biogenesis protein CcdA [Armatimonadota bacterium]
MKRWQLAWIAGAVFLGVAHAQLLQIKFQTEVILQRTAYAPGSPVNGIVLLKVEKPYHVNANPPSEDYLIPTELKIEASKGYKVGKIEYPKPLEKAYEFSQGKPLKVYEGDVPIKFQILLDKRVPKGTLVVKATLRYQACDDRNCYPPRILRIEIKIPISDKEGAVNPRYEQALKGASQSKTDERGGLTEYQSRSLLEQWVEDTFRSRRWVLFAVVLFLGGLSLNLTPCVLPLIPITLGFFSMQAQGQVRRRITLTALYALSMASMYAGLGTVAAVAGKAFGFQLQNPWVVGTLAVLIVLFALSLFDVYKFQVPPALMRYVGARQGWIGAILMGMLAGVAAAPCIGPVIVALISIVAALANPWVGFLVFLLLGLGLGAPYFVLGLFYERLQSRLPRSGEWTVLVERVFGVLLLAVALYFANTLMPADWQSWAWVAFLGLAALYFLLAERKAFTQPRVLRFKQALGVVLALWMGYNAYSLTRPKVAIVWEPYSVQRLEQAKAQGKPVVIDFTAQWCIACGELKRYTFTDPAVVRESERFVRLVVDATRATDPTVQETLQRHEVVGLPTVIFIDSQGNERRDLRLTGFEPASKFLKRLQAVR